MHAFESFNRHICIRCFVQNENKTAYSNSDDVNVKKMNYTLKLIGRMYATTTIPIVYHFDISF